MSDEPQKSEATEESKRVPPKRATILDKLVKSFKDRIQYNERFSKEGRSKWAIARGVVDVVLIIVSLSLAIYLAEKQKACRDDFFAGTTGLIVTDMLITTTFKIAVSLMRFSRSAQRHLSKTMYFLCKSILSVGFCASMLPWILINSDCDHVNPIYQDAYKWVIVQQIAIVAIASLLVIGIGSFFILNCRKSVLLATSKTYERILWRFSGGLGILTLAIIVHTTVVVLASLKDPIPLVIVELLGLVYYLAVSVQIYFGRRSQPPQL